MATFTRLTRGMSRPLTVDNIVSRMFAPGGDMLWVESVPSDRRAQAMISLTTRPFTSVNRKSRPLYR